MTTLATHAPTEFTLTRQATADRRSPVRWLLSHTLRHWHLALMMTGGALGNAALAALVPILVGRSFDQILTNPDRLDLLGWTAFFIALSQFIRAILQFGRNFGAELIAQRMERDIRDELYLSLLGKSMTFHSLQPVGDTMARATNDVREINFMLNPGLNLVIGSGYFLLMPSLFAGRYHPSLIIAPLVFLIGYIIAIWHYLNELSPITHQVRANFGKMNARLAEALDGIETVKSMAQECQEINHFQINAETVRASSVRQGDVEARFVPLLLLVIIQAAGLLHAVLLQQQGLVSVGDVVAYFGLLQLFGFPTFVSLMSYSQVSLGLAGASRVLELIKREDNLDQNKAGYSGPLTGEVEFRDASFAYPSSGPSLQNLSFTVKPGQTVAIVGQTGAGKTSLIKLMNRTYDAQSGQVLVDGVDVRDWNLEALRRGISIIEQDIFLFSRTIAENIAFGKPGASQAEIEEAARAAQADEFINSFPEGYQTMIGERGVTLSGGQRQRLALARAFLTNPPVLVLDDSTSAIDSATEDRIQRAIYAAARGRTTFIITHRLSQIRWADVIIILKQGRIEGIGSHETLMQTSAAYRAIFRE